jgi:hypothetical protein
MSKVLASKRRVVEATAVHQIVEAGGYAGGTSGCAGFIRGAARQVGVTLPVTDEVCAERRTHNLTMCGESLNLGRGQQIFDAALPSGRLVSIKGGDSRDVTVAVEALRAFIEAGGDVTMYHLTGEAQTIREGQTIVEPATNLMMRRASLAAIIEAQGSAAWDFSDSSEQFAFVRMDGKYPRFRIHWSSVPADCFIDANVIPFHTDDDMGGVTYESMNDKAIAECANVAVFESGKVTVDGVEIAKPMRSAESKLLAAIINGKGEAVKGCRQTATTMKKKLGHASECVQTVRGKGYRVAA